MSPKLYAPATAFWIVDVANTWLNRLIANDKKALELRCTNTNQKKGPTTNKPWWEETPKPSELLVPAKLRMGAAVQFD